MNADVKVSLIIVTYNRPDALAVIYNSLTRQTVSPDEVIIADDGSGNETRKMAENIGRVTPFALKHFWQEDRGFRASRIRNEAISRCSGNYIIFSDGDLFFHPLFISDFKRNAVRGEIQIGSRVFLTQQASAKILENKEIPLIMPVISKKIEKNHLNSMRLPFLKKILPDPVFSTRLRGGLLGVWRSDLVKVNGWNESFTGWGYEDTELVARLYNSGLKIKKQNSRE
jgi:glycosyltransferase involved in cell wall biosynthesis